MNKKILLTSSAVALALSGAAFAGGSDNMAPAAPAAPAAASGQFYVSAQGGYTMATGKTENDAKAKTAFKDNNKNGFNGAVAFGYHVPNMPVRLQLKGLYSSFKGKAATNDKLTIMGGTVDAIYDFNMGDFSPYIGVGAGYGQFKLSGGTPATVYAGKESGLIYNVLAGVSYKINSNLSATLGYQLLGNSIKVEGTPTTKTTDFSSVLFHSFNVGLRYSFA